MFLKTQRKEKQPLKIVWNILTERPTVNANRYYRTLAIEVDLSLPSVRVVRVLERIVAWRGYPEKIRMDNGPEFISVTLADWAEKHEIQLEFIKPGKPTQNSYVERFNWTYRTEVLNMYAFQRLSEVREITGNWIREYNEERPHDSLGDLTPSEYLTANSKQENSKSAWS